MFVSEVIRLKVIVNEFSESYRSLDLSILDIVFFGESLPSEFYHNLDEDSEKVFTCKMMG